MTAAQRDTLDGTTPSTGGSARMIAAASAFQREKADKARGLTFFNIDSHCLETRNGTLWVTKCRCGSVPCCPENTPATPYGNILTLAYGQYSGTKNIVTDAGITAESACRQHWYASQNANVFDTIVPPTAFSTASPGTMEYWVAQWRKPCESPRLKVTVNVTESMPAPTSGNWVGAFWRNSQTGERVIYAANNNGNGNWRVEVTPGSGGLADDVVLAAGGSADPNYLTDNVGDAENYQVPGNLTEVSGTGNILFRIGLKNINTTGTPTERNPFDYSGTGALIYPPRYATLTLTVDGDTNSPYTLYLRQGEAADYVFRPTDKATGGDMINADRDLAVKFATYNLTADGLTDGTGLTSDTMVVVPPRGAVFTDYPTQAGAFFQWAGDAGYERRAYHPVHPKGNLPTTGAATNGTYWNTLGANHETCPAGYRRFTVGDIDNHHDTQAASGNELVHSLFYSPVDDGNFSYNNSSYRYEGYYADGYFDRRSHTHAANAVSANNPANTVVAGTTKYAACIGTLFTNPATNASLFIPKTGYRTGGFSRVGDLGYYWSSSANTDNKCWLLYLTGGTTYLYTNGRGSGFPVRPVLEPPCRNYAISNNTLTSGSTTIASGTVITLSGNTASSSPAGGTVTYLWEESADGTVWKNASIPNNGQNYTTPSLSVKTYYRRIASVTGCATVTDTTAAITVDICTSYAISNNTLISGSSSITNGAIITLSGNTASSSPAGGTVTYLWEESADGSTWANASGTTNNAQNYTTPGLTAKTWYRRIASVTAANACATVTDTTAVVVINVLSAPSGNWVGAFWRNGQKGERVIYAANTGAWTVTVEAGGMSADVILAAGGSNDPNYWTDSPGDAESYPVPGTAQSISGTGNILFRIGLKRANPGTLTEDNPFEYSNGGALIAAPRYATLKLHTTGGDQTLYLRQGEAADYVFRNNILDDAYGTSNTRRTKAAKFVPYNLTNANLTGADAATAGRGGVFVDYPTKAGAFFQWANTTKQRYAFNPVNPTGAISGWSNSNVGDYWDAAKVTHETAPPGYGRPDDGATNAAAANNTGTVTMSRESLYKNPQTYTSDNDHSNSVWGFYADGYFDRRSLSAGNSGVSTSTKDVAYIGRLFFNSNNKASLFFPAAGYRESNNGQLSSTGYLGRYWLSSAYNAGQAWSLNMTSSRTSHARLSYGYGCSIRCVKD
jgi:hypothetical protein